MRAHRWVRCCPACAVLALAAACGEGAHAFERGRQPLGPHRLDQVIDRRGVERRQRVRIEGGAEHHRRARFERGQVARRFQSVDAGHDDVQQHQVGRCSAQACSAA